MSDSNGRLQRDKHGFIHPSTEEQIQKLIKDANNDGKKVRVRGSSHSVSGAILTDLHAENPMDERELNLVLDKYTVIRFDEATKQVTVQAGCRLVYNSKHPSEEKVGLLPRIDEKGWALPDLGGITHQTVAGFVSTGSAGGSLQASLDPSIVAIRIIDAKGTPHDLSENNESNLFHAAGVSMGLLGVISTVTFQCIDRFDIKGKSSVTPTDNEKCEIDLFGPGRDGKKSLQSFLEDTEYARLLWWPQRGVERVEI